MTLIGQQLEQAVVCTLIYQRGFKSFVVSSVTHDYKSVASRYFILETEQLLYYIN